MAACPTAKPSTIAIQPSCAFLVPSSMNGGKHQRGEDCAENIHCSPSYAVGQRAEGGNREALDRGDDPGGHADRAIRAEADKQHEGDGEDRCEPDELSRLC
jgi:hypothetical protein